MDFQLIVYLNKSDSGTTYELENSYILGRNKACEIYILSSIVSNEHCTLILMPKTKVDVNQYYVIQDGVFAGNSSKNGTFINGKRITKTVRLNNQDEITFGGQYPKAIFLILEEEYDNGKETCTSVETQQQISASISSYTVDSNRDMDSS